MNDFFNDLQKDLRNFGEGRAPERPVLAKDMTLRDYIAGQTMPRLVAEYGFDLDMLDEFAHQSYAIADALMEARQS